MIAPARQHAVAWPIAPEAPYRIDLPSETPETIRDVPARRRAIVDDDARPTLARPTLGATGLFQGWGPRLR